MKENQRPSGDATPENLSTSQVSPADTAAVATGSSEPRASPTCCVCPVARPEPQTCRMPGELQPRGAGVTMLVQHTRRSA